MTFTDADNKLAIDFEDETSFAVTAKNEE